MIITYSIPFFFLFIGVEILVGHLKRRSIYRLNDSINDLSCGILQQVVGLFGRGVLGGIYIYVHAEHRLFEIETASLWAWGVCFLGVDFCYYWYHRLAHEVNALWAAHIVHHQSEEYNLTVALRQGAFQPFTSWIFYTPLALAGFPPEMFFTLSAINTVYQFWIHTRLIGRLGPFEWVFNTPSHHRVHHGRNPKYLDKNYAGSLIIWDRMFGSFQPEEEEVVYGVTEPPQSWNPVWANLHWWVKLFSDASRARRGSDKLLVFLKPPRFVPEGVEKKPHVPLDAPKYDRRGPPGAGGYVFAQFVLALLFTVGLLFGVSGADTSVLVLPVLWVVLSLVSLSGLFDERGWFTTLEPLRLLGAIGLAALLVPPSARLLAAGATGLVALVSGWWGLRLAPRRTSGA